MGGPDDEWERAFEAVGDFAEKEGHARVPQSFVVDGRRLGNWVSTQRIFRRNGKLIDRKLSVFRLCLAGRGTLANPETLLPNAP